MGFVLILEGMKAAMLGNPIEAGEDDTVVEEAPVAVDMSNFTFTYDTGQLPGGAVFFDVLIIQNRPASCKVGNQNSSADNQDGGSGGLQAQGDAADDDGE